MEDAEKEARAKGRKYVMSVLQRPEQLEKVGIYRQRVARKKASVDASVKTALQSQLDGVRKGLELLRTAQKDVEEVRRILDGFDTSLVDLPQLDAIKEEHRRHSQLATAMENLKHIYTVPEVAERTKGWIAEGKLLYARQSLAELENSRDDLLFELHKLNGGPKGDTVLLNVYFEKVRELSDAMWKQVQLVLVRTLNTVRKDPTVIVTALRVIEWEEAADLFALNREKQTGFLPPGRPKRWKVEAFKVLQEAVASRIEGTQTDEREDDKMWLVRHFELMRQLVVEDLQVVKTLCVPCFPPKWKIVEEYTSMYQTCLRNHVLEIVSSGLEGNELVTLLAWALNTYPELGLTGPLLTGAHVKDLQDQYLKHIENNLAAWMTRTLEKEQDDWKNGVAPEEDGGVFLSPAPAIIAQMVEQHLSVARTVSPALTTLVQSLCLKQVGRYAQLYAEAVRGLRARHFQDRSRNAFYTQHMIAVLNNCVALHDATVRWRRDDGLQNAILAVRDESIHFLLQEAFSDLKPQFDVLFSQPWLSTRRPIDTIVLTFEDYFQDYSHLLPDNLDAVSGVAQTKIAKAYIYKIIEGNISFSSYEERKVATTKIANEMAQIQGLFDGKDPAFDLVDPLLEVIRSEDSEMLLLDLARLVEVFPEVTDAQLSSLLLTRGDLTRAEVREKVVAALAGPDMGNAGNTLIRKGMFSLMGKGALNLDWDHYWSTLINNHPI